MDTTTLTAPVSQELEKIITDAHIELNDGEQIKMSYLPYFEQLAKVKEDAKKINFQNPSPIDSQIAKQLRLDTMRIRTGSEKIKEERKRVHMLKSNLEQSAWNLIRDTCKLEEANFEDVEKFAENQEKLRIANLATERTQKLIPYHSFERDTLEPSAVINLMYPNLGMLSDDQFEMMLSGAIMAHEKRIADAKKAELERVENERRERVFQERKDEISPLMYFYKDGLVLSTYTTQEEFDDLKVELKRRQSEWLAEQERIRIENEKLKEQQAIIEIQLAEERARAEADLALRKEQEEIAARKIIEAQNKANAELKAEREKAEALQAELEAKKNAEIKARKDQEKADKKAAAAPDKEKLISYAKSIEKLIADAPEIKSPEYDAILSNANTLLLKVTNYIADKIKEVQ